MHASASEFIAPTFERTHYDVLKGTSYRALVGLVNKSCRKKVFSTCTKGTRWPTRMISRKFKERRVPLSPKLSWL